MAAIGDLPCLCSPGEVLTQTQVSQSAQKQAGHQMAG